MKKQFKDRESGVYLKNNGTFVIEDYNLTKPFANFFPGIAGEYGVPIWAFYVNRGQCISSFGTKDKDHALLEFFPANKAWQLTPNLGFRSFLKITDKNKHIFYEPFHNGYASSCFQLKNMMLITSFDLTIKEENRSLGLETEINYFPIPNERFAALGRIVRIKNRSRRQKVIQFLDGLPAIIPMGIGNRFLKDLNRTAEAWMKAQTVGDCAAFYKLDVDPSDRPQVIHIKEGNFCMSFTRPIIDASSIFGPRLNFDYPYNFIKNKKFVFPRNQVCESKTPCGIGLAEFSLRPDEERSFCSLFGSIASQNLLNQRLPEIKKAEFFMLKKAENKEIILKLEEDIDTKSSSCEFNYYCRQTYLDNIIRGGYPVIFDSVNDKKQVFYLYLRKHGDLERDYNKFYIQPTYFSQGNGNFRDIVQNRRSDVWFNPEVEESNLITFFNLIQTDGYNPLIVKGLRFHLKNRGNFEKTCLEYFKEEDDAKKLLDFLDKPFTPGGVVYFIEKNNFTLKKSSKDFLNILMVNSLKEEDAEHAQENHHMHGGYWSDHWTYCLDLLEAYLEIYPEKIKDLLFNKREFKFFDSFFVIKPRKERYVFYEGKIRQLDSVILDKEKEEIQKQRPNQAHWTRTQYGEGKIYHSTLIAKLISILVNKITLLDPFGCGIEMEANKPNWYDALNGLPALFGSSICETIELKKLILFLKNIFSAQDINKVLLFKEASDFLKQTFELLNERGKDFDYWDKSSFFREDYRRKTHLGIDGEESEIGIQLLSGFLDKALDKVNSGINKALDKKENLYCSYFINQVDKYEVKDGIIYPREFTQKRLPLFLEGQVHALKIQKNKQTLKDLYAAIKKSELYDRKLKMYKVTGNLSGMPFEIGRCRAFSRGWLENESIWLHMEYKYLLELLRSGLYEEFYSDFKNVLICFQDPRQYGRSILENSSFIASSVFCDKNLHGTGFVARLSGSTAEFLHIWRIMNAGEKPFFLDKSGKLNLKFAPVLAGWIFNKNGTYGFNFLSSIKVLYRNLKRKNTFGKGSVSIKKISFKDTTGSAVEISGDTIPSPYAEQIRSRLISNIEITLA